MNGDNSVLRRFFIREAVPALAVALAGALAVALLLAGCGSSSGSSAGAATTASATGSTSAFESCLKQHGVTITAGQFGARPSGSFRPSAFPSGSFRPTAFPSGSARPRPSFTRSLSAADSAAFKACAKYAPAGFGVGGAGRAISSSALAAFKSCLSNNGIKVTGKTVGAVMAEVRGLTGKKATAVQTCRVLLQPSAPSPSPSA